MDQATLQRVRDPFFTTRTTRHVGLGIPLLNAAAERCGGELRHHIAAGCRDTVLWSSFRRDHIDRAPLGDMKSTLLGVLLSHQDCELRYVHRLDERDLRVRHVGRYARSLGRSLSTIQQCRTWIEDYLAQEDMELEAPYAAEPD